jgi:hypothetical protein
VEKTDDTIANNVETLGLIGKRIDSSDDKIAAAEITYDGDKIKITSKAAGTAVITVSNIIDNKATINVTIDSKGQIVIEDIAQYVKNYEKAIKITGLPANQTIQLVRGTSADISSDTDIVMIGTGKTYAAGIAQIPLDKEWNENDSYYVGIIFDSKLMTSRDKIAFTSSKNVVNCSVSDFEEVNVQTGTLTITNIPEAYTHIFVVGLSGTVDFIGTSLIGSVPVINGATTIKLFAAESESKKPVDFPATGEYMLMVLVGAEPFVMIDEEPSATATTFMGYATFTNRAATVDWKGLILYEESGE